MHHTITPPFRFSDLRTLSKTSWHSNDLNGLNHLNDLNFSSNPFYCCQPPPKSTVQLHHGIELSASNPGQRQLLVEELLVGDQNL